MIDQKFRKKPVVVHAILCKVALWAMKNNWKSLPTWLSDAYEKGGVVATDKGIYLPTLEGSMLANPNDWIICGAAGEVYPCKPDIFATCYEEVLDDCST